MSLMKKDKLLRVTQLNAIFLDKEIYRAFLQIIAECNKHLSPGLTAPYEPEINFIIRMAILKHSILRNGSTFGQQLLSIKYENMNQFRKIIFILTDCLEYLKDRLGIWKPSHEVNRKLFKAQLLFSLLNFINFSIFLRNGVKPRLIDRVLWLKQDFAKENVSRHYETKYMARELLWNGFIEILIHIIPLINYHRIKRTVRHLNPFHKRPTYIMATNRVMSMHSKCAHCGENPILPHHMGCAHVFCYVCLKGNQVADPKYECPTCEHRNPNVLCDRVSV